MRRRYFAYGLNLDIASMAERCPKARLVGTAELGGYRFAVNRLGLATVLPAARCRVLGVLWSVTPRDEESLDSFEGVLENLYVKERIRLSIAGKTTSALIYRAVESRPGPPRQGYLENIIAAARTHGFSDDYITEISSFRNRTGRASSADSVE